MNVQVNTINKFKVHKDFIAVGWNISAVIKGVEDNTSLRDLQPEQGWNGPMLGCRILKFSDKPGWSKKELTENFEFHYPRIK